MLYDDSYLIVIPIRGHVKYLWKSLLNHLHYSGYPRNITVFWSWNDVILKT